MPTMRDAVPRRARVRLAGMLALSTVLSTVLAACASGAALLGREPTFTQTELQRQLERRFPREYERLGGWVSVRLTDPRLTLPDDGRRRLRLDLDFGVGMGGRTPSRPMGHLALSSGLRYDRASRSLHLDAPELERVDADALGGTMGAPLREALNVWLADYARNEPVYRLDDTLAGRLAARRVVAARIEAGRVRLELED